MDMQMDRTLQLSGPAMALIAYFTVSSFMKALMSFSMFEMHLSSASQHTTVIGFQFSDSNNVLNMHENLIIQS